MSKIKYSEKLVKLLKNVNNVMTDQKTTSIATIIGMTGLILVGCNDQSLTKPTIVEPIEPVTPIESEVPVAPSEEVEVPIEVVEPAEEDNSVSYSTHNDYIADLQAIEVDGILYNSKYSEEERNQIIADYGILDDVEEYEQRSAIRRKYFDLVYPTLLAYADYFAGDGLNEQMRKAPNHSYYDSDEYSLYFSNIDNSTFFMDIYIKDLDVAVCCTQNDDYSKHRGDYVDYERDEGHVDSYLEIGPGSWIMYNSSDYILELTKGITYVVSYYKELSTEQVSNYVDVSGFNMLTQNNLEIIPNDTLTLGK